MNDIKNPSGAGLVLATALAIIPFFWPVTLYMWLRYLTGHRAQPVSLEYATGKAGRLSRLVAEGHMSEEKAEQWLAAWEVEARARHLDRLKSEWWAPSWDWISEQRLRG